MYMENKFLLSKLMVLGLVDTFMPIDTLDVFAKLFQITFYFCATILVLFSVYDWLQAKKNHKLWVEQGCKQEDRVKFGIK